MECVSECRNVCGVCVSVGYVRECVMCSEEYVRLWVSGIFFVWDVECGVCARGMWSV